MGAVAEHRGTVKAESIAASLAGNGLTMMHADTRSILRAKRHGDRRSRLLARSWSFAKSGAPRRKHENVRSRLLRKNTLGWPRLAKRRRDRSFYVGKSRRLKTRPSPMQRNNAR